MQQTKKRMRISRYLNHMPLRDIRNYAIENEAIIEVNDGVVEEIIIEVDLQ